MIVHDLGRTDFASADAAQRAAHAERLAGGPDQAFIMKLDPVLTLGRRADPGMIRVPQTDLDRLGVPVVRTDRGGEVTAHFPGQIVVFFVTRIAGRPGGLRRFVSDLERLALETAAEFGVAAMRVSGRPGLFTERGKLCSLGLCVQRGVTRHGIALNVAAAMPLFDLIHPCGLTDVRPTSLETELGRPVPLQVVKEVFIRRVDHFA